MENDTKKKILEKQANNKKKQGRKFQHHAIHCVQSFSDFCICLRAEQGS